MFESLFGGQPFARVKGKKLRQEVVSFLWDPLEKFPVFFPVQNLVADALENLARLDVVRNRGNVRVPNDV